MPSNHNAVLPMFSPMARTPEKKYHTIVADPPWDADGHYPSMSVEELMQLPVGLWAAENAHLYLWTTNTFIVEAHSLARAWGFEVKTILTWFKNQMSMGYYFRGNPEHVIFGVRGTMRTRERNVTTGFMAPRGSHSEKPSTFYDIVERMSWGPYLDVFARKQRMGWDTFGDEAFNFGTEHPAHEFTGVSHA